MQRYSCSSGHEKVLWSMTGGWRYRTKFGTKTDDTRCWYCGAKSAVPELWVMNENRPAPTP